MKANSSGKAFTHPMFGLIPNGWRVYQFQDVFEFLPTNSFSRDEMKYGGHNKSIFNIHYGDIHATFEDQVLDFNKSNNLVPTLLNDNVKVTDKALLKDGDLIIADASEDYEGVGECIELKNIGKRKVISGLHTIAVRDSRNITVPGFRAYILKHPITATNLKKIATGSKVYGISKGNIARLEILIPPKPIQFEIAKLFSVVDKRIETTEKLALTLRRQKKGLITKLLTGS